ncbi:MAG TPA: CHRD domain-containing protein [Acidimicrobiia bacterium]|nr:CHRD domain-containing protein [Acidimicrobiia bacterium]
MKSLRILTAVVLSLALAACGGDDEEGKDTEVTTETTTGGTKTDGTAAGLKATLSGAEEVPGPGANPAVGAALVDIAGTKVCSDLKATMGEKPTKAHIHQGAKGASGPVVVDLMPAFNPGEAAFTSKTCVETAADTAAKLIADPAGYYVNIHSEGHPDGAMRGQLAKV